MTHSNFKLRPYQREAVEAVETEWRERDSTLLVQATGTGKTVVFSALIDRILKKDGKNRVLVLAHRGELLEQAQEKMLKAFGIRSGLEKADSHACADDRVVVASVQTLREKRLTEWPDDHFNYIIIDEAHHTASDSYRRILKYFHSCKLLGVTATPDRGDKKALADDYESIAYEYTIERGIQEGYLSPVAAELCPVPISMKGVHLRAGDYDADEIGQILGPLLDTIADEVIDKAGDRKIMFFSPIIPVSQKLNTILNRKGMKSVEVNGETKDRGKLLSDFERGKYQAVCNVALLTEGFDCPAVDCIVNLRPTKIRSLYTQIVGRGLRLSPGKKNLLLLDFLWDSAKHDLCKPASLLGDDDRIKKRVTEKITDEEQVDIFDQAEKEKRSVKREKAEKLSEAITESSQKRGRTIDPLKFVNSIDPEDLDEWTPTFPWEREAPTDKQIATLQGWGFDTANVDSRGKASMIIGRMMKRMDKKLSTPKQIRQLVQRGFTRVDEWTKDEATEMINGIADNGWRTPRWVNPSSYMPDRLKELYGD